MKTRSIILLAVAGAAAVPFITLAACNGDSSSQTDGGNDVNTSDVNNKTDGGTDSSCATGLAFDNTLVPGWPNNIPQP